MCGICGIYESEGVTVQQSVIERMTDSLVHRGPDAGACFRENSVALGHRRLSIIDLSQTGAQPMTLGNTTIAYNGETYNFPILRKELESLGHKFRGNSDTEVVLQTYIEWGLEGLERLEGIFSLALWDGARKRMVLMRDRLGVKPLFYSFTNGRLVFGSEIKAVLAAGNVATEVDDQSLAEYLWYGNTFEDRTIYTSVRSLQPGHRLIAEAGSLTVEPWWKVEDWLQQPGFSGSESDAADAVAVALDKAVARQLVSDVPVCIFLSGGIDSSSIAASAVAATGQQLTSYAVGFDFAGDVNELPKARRVADVLGLRHEELHIRGDNIRDVVDDLVISHDEPFADAANIPLSMLARELGGSVKVALQGDGGDEMFAGYRRHSLLDHVKYWRRWPRFLESMLNKLPSDRARRLARLGSALGNSDPAMRMALLLTMETIHHAPTALLDTNEQSRLDARADPFQAFRQCAARFSHYDPVDKMLLTDMQLQLPSQFLPKVDRATMAHGLEARVPLLDEYVVKLALTLPSHMKVKGDQKKIVLRNAMRKRLPADILDGPKAGFGVPYGQWLRGPLYEYAQEAMLDQGFLKRFSINESRLTTALGEHRDGTRSHGFTLWKYFQLALWHGSRQS